MRSTTVLYYWKLSARWLSYQGCLSSLNIKVSSNFRNRNGTGYKLATFGCRLWIVGGTMHRTLFLKLCIKGTWTWPV
ncbi:hypothetical protein TorRG33x02_004270 [Trema orientale]|uniref:Uncharacterized protein n=1 Tax=Trema orientale TaxID=63057 RepID=A0A2P5G240_TREOI|nr:hypothetical protein TorRG33x02_004270 [Trema orientale]